MKRLLSMTALDERLVYALIREWQSPEVQPSIAGQLSQESIPMRVGLRQGGSDSSFGICFGDGFSISSSCT